MKSLVLTAFVVLAQGTAPAALTDCKVVWDSPSADARGSMPIGNGDIANTTWPRRRHPENGGWQQNSIQAALLGRAEEARALVVDSASRHAGDFRFPAMWGPNYDWTPDQDHGSVMMSALRRLLVQYEGDWNRVRAFELQARQRDGAWNTIAAGETLGLAKEISFAPVTAGVFRLNIPKADDVPTLCEFELHEANEAE